MDRGHYMALLGGLVVILAVASLPTLLAPKVKVASVEAPQTALEALSTPEPPQSATPPPEPVERLLGGYVTLFKTAEKDERVHNITLGAEKLNGSVLKPGEVWSFNATVGPRTEETGFKDAPTLFMGEVLPGLGGGMCQVSSTIHAAAMLMGVEVVKRQPHSRPSSYIPVGFDATVNYPEHCWGKKPDPNTCFDLQLRNPYSFPVTIHARVHDPEEPTTEPKKALTVELWGVGPVAEVKTSWKVYSTPPFEKRWRRAWKRGEWKKLKQSGANGVTGARLLDITWPDGRTEHKVMPSRYKPVDEVWWVGRDWDKEKKPWE